MGGELHAAAATYHRAVVMSAAGVYAAVKRYWVSLGSPGGGGRGFSQAVRGFTERLVRRHVRAVTVIAVRHARLERALRLGETYSVGEVEAPTLGVLRREFVDAVRVHVPAALRPVAGYVPYDPEGYGSGGVRVKQASLGDVLDAIEREEVLTAAEIQEQLNIVLEPIEGGGWVVDESEGERLDKLGSRAAARSERVVMNAARGVDIARADNDPQIWGAVRVHQPNPSDGKPCAWCAALMSRGAVYRNKRVAKYKAGGGDLEKFHENCHCEVYVVYSREEYENDPRFSDNRRYLEMWERAGRDMSTYRKMFFDH